MAVDGESEHLARNNIDSASFSIEREARISEVVAAANGGGWITFPFIAATVVGMQLCNNGWAANLVVYLIQEFNISSINATKISNVVNGCTLLLPVMGAIIADSFFGSFTVIWISTFISLLGSSLLTVIASLDSLRPQRCEIGSSFCESPSKSQFAILYASIAMLCIGIGGSRYVLTTMGAYQFDNPHDQGIFFNWFFIAYYVASVISSTVLIYIEENVSWKLGFGICIAANFAAFAIFLLGKRFYRRDKPQGSPFVALARVIVATVRKWRVALSTRSEDYYQETNEIINNVLPATFKQNFRFLNRAALKTEGDIRADGSIAKSWRLCSVQQVEDLKALIRIFPLWSSGLILSTTAAVANSLTLLQALTMNRHLGPHFEIPAISLGVINFLSSCIFLIFIDRLLSPLWKKLTRRSVTPLQRIGAGHFVTATGMVVSALIEIKRLKIAHANPFDSTVPMLALWLIPQMVLGGIGEALYFPGQVSLYYQEFPASLRSTSTSMSAMILGIGFYLSTAFIDIIHDVTAWLPDNINNGRVDNVQWTLLVLVAVNFCYYMVCSLLYKYQNAERGI
ncbi:protein NRT1/ PTR FAMILY 2.7-like [Melia azedarach]|uniref:Protein NRT1/ PTR FAMILY 2.7-like n=2 Tax=Melia azedarach TaxID=155640 RepID=A0ACC1YQ61_MELAZ|nr:protein NRT1/ PTR FAMILY 2.7-like [Melia azedarach]KAJ4725951.1 protein NRT1/ PTR FAMILY 2.7-like [Melia azedarach]